MVVATIIKTIFKEDMELTEMSYDEVMALKRSKEILKDNDNYTSVEVEDSRGNLVPLSQFK